MPKRIVISPGIVQVTFAAGKGPEDFPGQLPKEYQAIYSDVPGDGFFITDTSNSIEVLTGKEIENLPTPKLRIVCESKRHKRGPFRVARVHFEPDDSPSGLGGLWTARGPGAMERSQISGPGGRIEEDERGPVTHRSISLECPKCGGDGAPKVRLRTDLWQQLVAGLIRQQSQVAPGEDLTVSLACLAKLAGQIDKHRRS